MMSRKQQQQQQESSPLNWWWLDPQNNTTKRSPWLQSTLSELDEKTMAILKLIEADADSFAQRAEMYYNKRPDLVRVVEEFYRMHRSLAELFDRTKTESATRLLKTLGSPFSCDQRFCLKKSTSPVKYRNYDTSSDTSDDPEDSPESEVEDPEENNGTEPTSPKDSSQGKVVGKALTQADGINEMFKLRMEVEKLREENQMLIYEMARKDEERKKATGRLGVLMDDITTRLVEENMRQIDEMERKDDQKREALRQLTMLTDGMERVREQNKMQREQMACEDEEKEEVIQRVTMPSNEVVRFDMENKMKKDALKEENPSWKNQAGPNLGNPNNPFEHSKTEVGCFLRRLFPKSSNKWKASSTLSFGTFL